MNEDVDPCEDFYNFTCGNWAFYNHITQGMAGYDTLTVQQFDVYDDLADILETDFTEGNKILTEMQDFYRSCIVAAQMNQTEAIILPTRQFYQELGGWSLLDIPGDGTQWGINSIQFIREKMLGSNAFYSINLFPNGDLTNYILVIQQSGLTLDYPAMYYHPNATAKLLETIVIVLSEFALGNYTEGIYDAASQIVEFETNLAQIWVNDLSSDYGVISVEELYNLWPAHDWLTVLSHVFPSSVHLSNFSTVVVRGTEYFRRLSLLVSQTEPSILENYAKWRSTMQLAEVLMSGSSLRESIVHFKEAVMGEPSMEQRQQCVSTTASVMPVALGRVYAQRLLPSGYKEAVMDLVSNVREGLRQRMDEVDWLDDNTRRLAIEKLEAIESRVAYPDRTFDDSYLEKLYGMYQFDEMQYTRNYLIFINISHQQMYSLLNQPVDKTVWDSSAPPTTVNAYYYPPYNQITILEAIMRIPSFDANWPLSMQYGALGMVLGHELTHGFDDTGRQFDKDGIQRMWWTEKAVETFNDRAQCFVNQYSMYEMFGIPVNGYSTLGENIADNGGIRASYNAYRRVAGKSKMLPGLSDYTNDQLFFIAFGQLWCAYTTELSFFNDVVSNDHSPDPIRVLGTLSNNEDFAEAFDCPVNSRMNPQTKCVLW
jgi:predicted metalloendopeptidase